MMQDGGLHERHPRTAGVLLHPTSLPGTGGLGPEAYRFVDLLATAGQKAWQIMPVGPPGPGDSPYAARSAFAGDPMLISLEDLRERGWLGPEDRIDPVPGTPERVSFQTLRHQKEPILRRAFARFIEAGGQQLLEEFREECSWLDDYALFAALRKTHDAPWWEWDAALRTPEGAAGAWSDQNLAGELRYEQFLQLCFAHQWSALKRYANERGVSIIGDIPIFVDRDSADVWANQHLFKLDESGNPTVVAGVPPDAFSLTGQRWGNPVYDWSTLQRNGYRWWADRMAHTFKLVDSVRLDHFRGFEATWEIPADEPTAVNGHWAPGPGEDLFRSLEGRFGRLPLIVEDLGLITPAVRKLRDSLGYPGMAVLQFAFGDDWRNPYLPHSYTRNLVAYTGTHDNDTTLGWFHKLGDRERASVLRYLGRDGSDIVSDMIRLAYESVADLVIVPMQDILGLGAEARMNLPGVADGNWTWRFSWDQVHPGRIDWLAGMTETYGRTGRSFAYDNE